MSVRNLVDLVVADLDQDGRKDIAISNSGLDILYGAGDATLTCQAKYAVGASTGQLGIADLNHDGRLDIISNVPGGIAVFLDSER